MIRRPLLPLLLCVLTSMSLMRVGAVEVLDSIKTLFDGRELIPVEGVWLWNSGAVIAITTSGRGDIILELVDSPDPLVDTPVVVGKGTFGGKPGTYNIEFYNVSNKPESFLSRKTSRYIATLSHESRLSLTPYSTGLKINAWRLIPYLFRFSVSKREAPTGIEGAIRIWPPLGSPEFPIAL